MKIAFTACALSGAVKLIAPAARRTHQSITEHLLLEASGQGLTVTACDLTHQVSTRVAGARILGAGRLTVPADKFLQLLSALPGEGEVTIADERDGSLVRMTCEASAFRLNGLDARDFPLLAANEPVTGEFSVNADQLLGAIAPVRGAMAHNDVRFYLNGLCIDLSALGTARLVATDGHRLHFIDTPIDEQARQSKLSELLLADTSIAHLAKLLQLGGDCKVQVLGERMVRVALGATTFTSKLIESKYADYKRILSELPDRQIEVSRDDLRQALQRMRAVLFDARVHAVRLDMDGADLRISVSGTGDEGEESITAVSSIASDFHANVTLPYLMEAVEACPGEAVRIAPTRTDGPIHILPTSSSSSYRAVVMPLRT